MDTRYTIMGLGNHGSRYEDTYHNIGFLFLDALHTALHATPWHDEHLYAIAHTDNYILVKPKTFMNESGKALAVYMTTHRLSPDSLIIAHDDYDIPLGRHKISRGRGDAGHKGVQSIITALGTNTIIRVRIGIGPDLSSPIRKKAEEIVLKIIPKEKRDILHRVFHSIITDIGRLNEQNENELET